MCATFVSSAPFLSQMAKINAFYIVLTPSGEPSASIVNQTLYPIGYLLLCASLAPYAPRLFQMTEIHAFNMLLKFCQLPIYPEETCGTVAQI